MRVDSVQECRMDTTVVARVACLAVSSMPCLPQTASVSCANWLLQFVDVEADLEVPSNVHLGRIDLHLATHVSRHHSGFSRTKGSAKASSICPLVDVQTSHWAFPHGIDEVDLALLIVMRRMHHNCRARRILCK